jgi:hypothetical protein
MRKLLKGLLGDSATTVIPGLFAVGSWFVSKFFKLPYDEPTFRAVAILGMLTGYALGNVCFGGVNSTEKSSRLPKRNRSSRSTKLETRKAAVPSRTHRTSLLTKLALRPSKRAWIGISVVAAGVIGVVTMVNYYEYVLHGEILDFFQLLWAASQLALIFACAGYLMPIAGIHFGEPEDEEEEEGSEGKAEKEYHKTDENHGPGAVSSEGSDTSG